ncbi:MAG: hypothetical protein ACI9S8_001522 [Chlamydiales bacterium]|jgi:hypothetical protein
MLKRVMPSKKDLGSNPGLRDTLSKYVDFL